MSDSIFVRAPNWVGDAIMALPFFEALRATVPGAFVTCLSRASTVSVYRDIAAIDHVMQWDDTYGYSGFRAIAHNARRLRKGMFRTGFSLPNSHGAAWLMWHAWIPERIGYSTDARRMWLTRSLPHEANGKRPHRVDAYLKLLSLKFPEREFTPRLHYTPGPKAVAAADELLHRYDRLGATPVLTMAPAAAQPNKMWMQGRFAEIAARWIRETDGYVFLLGGNDDRQLCDQVLLLAKSGRVQNFAGECKLATSGEIIRRSNVFVGNDSGLGHLATAVGCRAIVLSGPGDPTEVAPYGSRATTIKHPLFCSPCYKNTCWRTDKPIECLTEITVDEVWEHVGSVELNGADT